MQLFCKYSRPRADPSWHRAYGHRRGLAFEANVYQQVLQPLRVSVPALRGIHHASSPRQTWLLLEYLDNAAFVNKDPSWLPEAAEWLGRFHAVTERRVSRPSYQFLPRYDARYYRGWARRVRRSADKFQAGGHWLDKVCDGFEASIHDLMSAPQAVIHGEYYPANVLVRKGRIRPVDWETAAVGAGEIDLATLTDNWSSGLARDCERAYRSARWPLGAPREFARRLRAARFYELLRWAGEPLAWGDEEGREFYIGKLRSTGERLGLC